MRCILLLAAAALLAACGTKTSPQEVAFDMQLSAWRQQQIDRSADGDFSAQIAVAGTMTIENIDTGAVIALPWPVDVNPSTLEITSNRNAIIPPGQQRFTLVLSVSPTHQYIGVTNAFINDGLNSLAMTLRPVIGDTTVDSSIFGRLNDFAIQYESSDLENITSPRIGVIIDSEEEEIYQINKETGRASAYLNLSSGSHTVALRLYDGFLQVGRSIPSQEDIVVSPGEPITLDLVALAGETSFSFSSAGGDASFTFRIPDEVVTEAGGVANLETRASLVGPTNVFQQHVIPLAATTNGQHQGVATFTGIQYGPVTLTLTFADTSSSPEELLGSCIQQVSLGSPATTLACPIELRRRSIIGGRLLATVGINVFDADGSPITGAIISSNGETIGVTNSGFGSAGYLKAFLTPGTHTLVASSNGRSTTTSVTLPALAIANVDMTMPAAPAASVSMAFVNAATGTSVAAPISVSIAGEGASHVRDTNGIPRTFFVINDGSLEFQLAGSAQPSPTNPVQLVFIVSAEGFFGTSVTHNIVASTPTTLSTSLINEAQPPSGVSVVSNSEAATGTNGSVVATTEISTPADPQTGASASVVIPQGTVVTDANGQPLVGELTTQMAYFSPRSESALLAFPGGLDVTVNGAPGGQTSGGFASGGMVSVEIRDSSGRAARNFSGEGLEITIDVPSGMRNPITGVPLQNGDMIPVWSNDTNTGEWNYEGEAAADVVGTFSSTSRSSATFRAKHLSLWNLDWFINQCFLSRQIFVVDDDFTPIPNAVASTFRYRVAITTPDGRPNGYVKDVPANSGGGGFNVVQFYNAPRVNVMRIIVRNSMNNIIAQQGFNTSAGNGLCDGSGTLYLFVSCRIENGTCVP